MGYSFYLAEPNDLSTVAKLYRSAIQHMEQQGIPQWDELYPDEAILKEDIAAKELYLLKEGTNLLGCSVINAEQDPRYKGLPFRLQSQHIGVIHRLCVNPVYQNCGVGKNLLETTEQKIAAMGYDVIRLDAFIQNPFALKLYEKAGYQKVETITLRKGIFQVFEKAL